MMKYTTVISQYLPFEAGSITYDFALIFLELHVTFRAPLQPALTFVLLIHPGSQHNAQSKSFTRFGYQLSFATNKTTVL